MVQCCQVQSSVDENDLELCITNYYKEDSEYAYFKNRRSHFDLLCEVFQNQGVTGKYAQDSTQPPIDTDNEREQAMDWRQRGKKKVTVTVDSEAEEHEIAVPKSNEKNKGKGKRKTPEQSSKGGPFLQ